MTGWKLLGLVGALALCQNAPSKTIVPGNALERNDVVVAEVWVEPPTLKSIGVEWRIQGDRNRNAAVNVEYRETGNGAWRKALPLVRSQGEKVGNLVPPRALSASDRRSLLAFLQSL